MLWILLVACNGGKGPGVAGPTPTWGADVGPIVAESCVGCHHAGGLGGADFTTYAAAAPMASAMAAFVDGAIMPPPAMDPECRSYTGHERMVLTDDDKATLIAWADGGAPEGDALDALTWTTPSLAGADTEVLLPVAHAVTPGSDGNEYHCQILDNPFTETTYITGFDVLVDQPTVVHHTVLAIDGAADAGEWTGSGDLSEGWDCREKITEEDWSILHAWAPGMEPTEFPDGLGMLVEPGDQLVLQMHYFGSDADAGTIDQSGYRFTTADSVETEVYMEPIGPAHFELPAGEVSTPDDTMVNNFNVDVTVYGVFPHMHMLATGYEARIERSSGSECLASAEAWDFGHQATYMYDEPAVWARGETLYTSCTYDNTADNPWQYNDPPADVTWGEGSNQEMCYFLFYYSY